MHKNLMASIQRCYLRKNEKKVKSEEGIGKSESGNWCEEEQKVEDWGKCQFPLIGTPRE